MNSATEAVAGIGDLLVLGFALLAVIGWLLVATYATVRSGLRWLVVALVPLVVATQIWSPSARGIVFPETPIAGRPHVGARPEPLGPQHGSGRTGRRGSSPKVPMCWC